MSPFKRSMLGLAALLVCEMPLTNTTWAQSLSYTDGCEDRLGSSDEDLVEEAYLAAYRYRDRVWDEIDVDGGRPDTPRPCNRATSPSVHCSTFQQQRCYYSGVSDRHREKWAEAMEHVKVNCNSNKCSNNINQYGYCGIASWDSYPSDKILVCVDNIRSFASAANKAISPDAEAAGTFAKLAGTIAHEVMHQADGFQGHPTGSTDYISPNTSAESVHVAMEHLLLSPDLSTSIRSVETTWNGSAYTVTIQGTLYNLNEYAGPVGTTASSGRARNNTDARLAFYLDGAPFDYLYEAPIDGGASSDFTYSFEVEAVGGTGLHQFTVVTDDLDNIWELDEENNQTTRTFSIGTDLAVEFEIAGPYSTASKAAYRDGVGALYVTTYRHLTYNVTVTNRDDALSSPPATLYIRYDDMWSGRDSTVMRDVSALAPQTAETHSFSIDVPVVSGVVSGDTVVWFMVDPYEVVPDSNRDNNSVTLVINEGYFKPDYRISFDSLTIDGNNATATYTVKNIGPEAAVNYSWAGFYINGALASSTLTGKLAVATSASASMTSSFPGMVNLDSTDVSFVFLVKADRAGAIEENDEDNNTEDVTITVPGVTLVRDIERDDGWMTSAVIRDDVLRFIPESVETIFYRVFGEMDPTSWYFVNSGNGPFLPDFTYDVTDRVLLMSNAYSIEPPTVYILGR